MGKIIIIIQIRFFNIVFGVPENVSRQRPETYKPLAKISRPLIKKYKPLVNVSRPANMPWCHRWCDYRCDLPSKNSL
jgi:hypothetical protein